MATVYSLICFGGRTGKTVTLSIASPCVASLTNHGLRDGAGIVFSSSGSLPTGVTAGVTYYAKSTGDGTFNLYDTSANAIAGGSTGRVNTSGSQSGTHTVKSQKMLDLFSAYPGRWGSSGSERAYDGIVSWNSARSSASAFDTEVAEIGESFTEYLSGSFTTSVPSQKSVITTEINGVRGDGWHKGVFPSTRTLTSGYELYANSSFNGICLTLGRYRDTADGIIVRGNSWSCWALVIVGKPLAEVKNCILTCHDLAGGGYYVQPIGVEFVEPMTSCLNNLIVGCGTGIRFDDYKIGATAIGNLVTLCTTGIAALSSVAYGFAYNNISVGNTTNWSAAATYLEGASNNAGLSGEAWITSGGSRITIATTDFYNYGAKDYRPASASSPQAETGAEPLGILPYDLAGRFRPDYMNGATAYFDVGPYEYDHGYGPWPASATISLTSIVSGSRVLITKASDGTVLYNDVPGTSLSFNTTHIGDFNVVVRKATASPFYREFNASGTTVADQTTAIKCLQQLDE